MKQRHWRGNDHVWDDQEDGAYRRYQRICKGRPGDKKGDFPRLWRRQQERDCDIEANKYHNCSDYNTGRHINAVAVDAGFVADHVTEVDAHAKLHSSLWLDFGVTFHHLGLDGNRALDCIHHAGELDWY